MKKVPALLLSLSLLSPSFAFAEDTNQQNAAALAQLETQTKALQQQITLLKGQIEKLQSSQTAVKQEVKVSQKQIQKTQEKVQWNRKAIQQVSRQTYASKKQAAANAYPDNFAPDDHQFIHALREGLPVITSPYLGLRSSFDASDLIVNLPSMNQDLVLLKQRQDMELEALKRGVPFGKTPLIMLSGDILPQLIMGDNYQGQGVSDVTLSSVELDVQAISGSWASGFIAINYDNSTPDLPQQNVSTVSNSTLYVSRAFATIGNLNKAPIYLTAGQFYAPYGLYANSLITAPLTQAIGRTLIRSALLGYSDYGVYAEGYAYNGDTYIHNNNIINEGGLNAGYKSQAGDWAYDVGAGVISNMADSQLAQNNGITGTNQFQGFGYSSSSEQLQNRVPGGNLHAEVKYQRWQARAEYIGALRSYSNIDMTYDGNPAKPQATHLELDYNRAFWNKPTTFVLAYDRSWQALAYNVPEQSIFAVASISIWKDTIESIEYRHDANYPGGSFSTGNVNGGVSKNSTPAGPSQNTVTIQFGFYF